MVKISDLGGEDPEKLTEEEKAILSKFHERVADLDPTFDGWFLIKWLRARKFNIVKAEKMLREHFHFRKNIGIDTILTDFKYPEIMKRAGPYSILGFDPDGDIVVGVLGGLVDVKGITHTVPHLDRIKAVIYLMESFGHELQKQNMKTGKRGGKLVVIDDLTGRKLSYLMDKLVWRTILNFFTVMEGNYPEVLKQYYLLNTPSYFDTFFDAIKTFFDARPVAKFKIYGKDGWKKELAEAVGADILPACWGGNRTDPDGNPNCVTLLNRDTKVPKSLYLEKVIMTTEPDMTQVKVRARDFYDLPVKVVEANSLLKWIFYTVDYNIAYALYFFEKDGYSDETSKHTTKNESYSDVSAYRTIVPKERVSSNFIPERGDYVCKDTGTYVFHFDNTFSWLTQKELFYKFEVVPPHKDT